MARYTVARKGSAHSSPDSTLAWANSSSRYPSYDYAEQNSGFFDPSLAPDEELLDIWDTIWFGVSCSPDASLHHRKAKMTADPLESMAFAAQPMFPEFVQQATVGAMQHYLQPAAMAGSPAQGGMYTVPKHLQGIRVQQLQHDAVTSAATAAKPRQPSTPEAADRQVVVSSGSGEGQPAAGSVLPVPRKQQQSPQYQSPRTAQQRHRQPQQQDIDMEECGPAPYVLGTWAQRQYIMPVSNARSQAEAAEQTRMHVGSLAQPIPSSGRWPALPAATKGSGSGGKAEVGPTDLALHGSHAAAMAAAQAAAEAVEAAAGGRGRRSTEDDDEAVTQAAWRWRFTKRWQAEQARPPPDPAASVGDGGMEEALQYLAACGENWHLTRTASHEAGFTAESRMLGTLGTPSLLGAELLVDEGSYSAAGSNRGGLLQSTESGGFLSREASHSGMGRGEATRQVTGITKRAAQLLAAQSDINKAVTQRWREVQSAQASEMWVGALLESVEVDDWGKYKFLLLRVRDRVGRQKLLVRGANYASDAKLVEGLHRQMMSACAAHDVCAETIEVIGGGVMEWRSHRDRLLHISGGYVAPASAACGPSTPCEVMNLAAVLTKQHLPMHYKVTSEGGKAL